MEFIKDQEKRILLSAISREKKVIKEHKELAELIPVINQLEYYFMYDRLFKQIYNKGFMDGVNDTSERFKSSEYKQEHDSELLDKVAEKLKAEVNICKNCMIVDCDTEYFKPMCEKADKGFIVAEVKEIVDTVIAEMKKDTHTAM